MTARQALDRARPKIYEQARKRYTIRYVFCEREPINGHANAGPWIPSTRRVVEEKGVTHRHVERKATLLMGHVNTMPDTVEVFEEKSC